MSSPSPVVQGVAQDVAHFPRVQLRPRRDHRPEEGESVSRPEQGTRPTETSIKLSHGLLKTTFELWEFRMFGQERLHPGQVVQQTGSQVRGGHLLGELRDDEESSPGGELSALDDISVEMVPAVDDLVPGQTQYPGQSGGVTSAEHSLTFCLEELNLRGQTLLSGGGGDKVQRSSHGEIFWLTGVNNHPVKMGSPVL